MARSTVIRLLLVVTGVLAASSILALLATHEWRDESPDRSAPAAEDRRPVLSLHQSTETLAAGRTATLILTTTDAGAVAEPGPITLVDPLPAALRYRSASGDGWSCEPTGALLLCAHSGGLMAGTTTILRVVVDVDPTAAGASIVNRATVRGTVAIGSVSATLTRKVGASSSSS